MRTLKPKNTESPAAALFRELAKGANPGTELETVKHRLAAVLEAEPVLGRSEQSALRALRSIANAETPSTVKT